MCPAVRYVQQGQTWNIEDTMCRKHASIEFGGACGKEHEEQCKKYAPETFTHYGELMKKRHTNPAVAGIIGSLRIDMGTAIYNSMEVRTATYLVPTGLKTLLPSVSLCLTYISCYIHRQRLLLSAMWQSSQ